MNTFLLLPLLWPVLCTPASVKAQGQPQQDQVVTVQCDWDSEERARYLAERGVAPPSGLTCPGGSYWNGKGCTTACLCDVKNPREIICERL